MNQEKIDEATCLSLGDKFNFLFKTIMASGSALCIEDGDIEEGDLTPNSENPVFQFEKDIPRPSKSIMTTGDLETSIIKASDDKTDDKRCRNRRVIMSVIISLIVILLAAAGVVCWVLLSDEN